MVEKHPKRPRDLNQWAKRMVGIATGDESDREPTPEEQGKDPAAVALGRKGGLKGGLARAESLSPGERKKIAQEAAKKLWDNTRTLKVTPAMAAGVTDRLWEVSDMVEVLEAWEASL